MPKASPIQYNLNGGEWSPLLHARVDQEKYGNALALCRNFIPLVQGGVTRRPGTQFVAEVADIGPDSNKMAFRLVPFQFNVEQAYVLEVGVTHIRFFLNEGQLLDNGSPFSVSTTVRPFSVPELNRLGWAQSADQLFLAGGEGRPMILERRGATDWAYLFYGFRNGPYDRVNDDEGITMAFDGTDTVTVTGADPVNDLGILAGRWIRIFDKAPTSGPAKWYDFRVVSAVTMEVEPSDPDTPAITASDVWRLGTWRAENYPAIPMFFEGRLWWGGYPEDPQRIDGTVPDEFTDFKPTNPEGDVTADNALSLVLAADQVNVVQWLSVEERGLLAGTSGAEWIIRRAAQQEALAADNIQAVLSTTYGSARTRPLRIANVTLFNQRDTRTLRELIYVFEIDGFRAPDMTLLSEHLLRDGIRRMVYQQSPQKIVWVCTTSGKLLSFSYERDQDVIAWAQHDLGGEEVFVQDMAVIPSPDGRTDQLWMIVRRTINGELKFYVEFMKPIWEGGTPQEDAWFVDSGLEYNGAPTTSISGLEHLEGETVQVLTDGAVHPDRTVENGGIELDYEAEHVIVGLGYVSEGQTLNIEAGAGDGTAQGKTKRLHRVTFRFFETLGAEVGPDAVKADTVTFRRTSDPMDNAPPLFTGDQRVQWPNGYDREGRVYFRQQQPLPMTLLAIMPQLYTQDDG